MRANIVKLYILNCLGGLVFWYPIEKLFMQHIGISPLGISINAIVFLVIMVLGDIPAGILADRWRRSSTLLLAMLALAGSSVIGGFSHSLWQYVPMTILLGGFVVLTQGTFQALMYDSLHDLDRQNEYDTHQGRAYALFLAGLGVSSIAGGYIAQLFGYEWAYFATAAVVGIGAVLTLTLREPAVHKALADTKLKQHVASSARRIVASRLLIQLALLITAASVLRSSQNEYAGLLFIALGLGAIPMGYATAAKWLASAVGQIIAPKIGRRALQLAPVFFVSFTLFSLVHTVWSLAFFYIAGFLFAVVSNQAEAALQDATPSNIRATMLSIFSFASNVILVPLSLLFGWIADRSNVFNSYLMIALVGLLYLLAWLLGGRRILAQVYHQRTKTEVVPSGQSEIV